MSQPSSPSTSRSIDSIVNIQTPQDLQRHYDQETLESLGLTPSFQNKSNGNPTGGESTQGGEAVVGRAPIVPDVDTDTVSRSLSK